MFSLEEIERTVLLNPYWAAELVLQFDFSNIKPCNINGLGQSPGCKWWFKNGEIHRDNDEPAIHNRYGGKEWYKDGKRHREDGPAVVFPNGDKEWWVNGDEVCHKESWWSTK